MWNFSESIPLNLVSLKRNIFYNTFKRFPIKHIKVLGGIRPLWRKCSFTWSFTLFKRIQIVCVLYYKTITLKTFPRLLSTLFISSEVVLRNFRKFTGRHLWWLLLNRWVWPHIIHTNWWRLWRRLWYYYDSAFRNCIFLFNFS